VTVASEEPAALSLRPRRALLILLALLALGAIGGCATTFVYDRADRLANRWVGGYVELDPDQRALVEQGFRDLHDWHRREQLPAYAAWLRGAAARLAEDAPFSAEELRERGMELGAFWHALADAGMPVLVELGAGLGDAQVAELLAAVREEQQKQYADAARRTEAWHAQRRIRSMERFMRRWAGRLTEEQRVAMRGWTEQLEPTRAASFENRAGWVDELEAALADRGDSAALRQAAERLFVRPTERWSPDYAARVERNSAHTTRFMVDFLDGLEDHQRARAIERLERLAAQFEQLAAAGG
jgi:hypothetical protein